MVTLDDLKGIKKLDQERMAEKLEQMPEQYRKAWEEADNIKLPASYQEINQIVVCAMGGSAIGGDLAKDFCQIPFCVNRNYRLPDFINKESLIILISYSGNTEEVLTCLREAKQKKSKIFIISSDGELLKKAKELKLPFYKVNYFSPSRIALPYLFLPLIKILEKIKFLKEKINLEAVVTLITKLTQEISLTVVIERNIAKSLAYNIYDHIPLVIASEKFAGVARRWKTQFNENAKNFSFFDILPEAKHNTIEGTDFPNRNKDDLFFLLLQSNLDNQQIKKSFRIFKDFLERGGIKFTTIFGQGEDLLSQKISLICLGDWISFYLAILNQIDPSTTEKIKWFKEKLSK